MTFSIARAAFARQWNCVQMRRKPGASGTGVPGRSHSGPLPALTEEERAVAAALKRHVETIASREHNIPRYDELEKAARYIETTLASYGYSVGRRNSLPITTQCATSTW